MTSKFSNFSIGKKLVFEFQVLNCIHIPPQTISHLNTYLSIFFQTKWKYFLIFFNNKSNKNLIFNIKSKYFH